MAIAFPPPPISHADGPAWPAPPPFHSLGPSGLGPSSPVLGKCFRLCVDTTPREEPQYRGDLPFRIRSLLCREIRGESNRESRRTCSSRGFSRQLCKETK